MCGGPDSLRKKLLPPGFSMEEKAPPPTPKTASNSLLLELAATNDLAGFKTAADDGDVHAPAPWYGRRIGTKKMGWDQRTPLMIAALYGSADVLGHILLSAAVEAVNLASPSDGATALHCAAAGGAPNAAEVVRLLLAASADLHAVDAAGNRPADVIVSRPAGAIRPATGSSSSSSSSDGGSPKLVELEKKEKEYPVDASLPDINSGVYGTDEFRIYCFKVAPCLRAYSHDWTECPFVHPGENARRRDPRKYEYSCVPCPEFRKGTCRHGDGCEYAHGVFESWLHPAQYRTRLCKDEAGCARKVCFFAHKLDELRKPDTPFSSIDLLPPASPLKPPPSAGWSGQLSAAGRLKASLSAKGLDLGMELPALEGLGFSMPSNRSSALTNVIGGRSGKFGGHHLPLPLGGEAMGGGFDASGSTNQIQSSSLFKSLGYGGNLNLNLNFPSSPARTNSPMGGGLDSRAATFAKRSLSFCDRSVAANADIAAMPVTSAAGSNGMMLSDWSSPNGKLDWAVRGDELHRLTKSATFAIRSSGGHNDGGYGLGDGNEVNGSRGWSGVDLPRRSSADTSPEKRPAWGGEQSYVEEQMVA